MTTEDVKIRVYERLQLGNLLELPSNEQIANLQEHHEGLLELIEQYHFLAQESSEKTKVVLYEFAARLCNTELALFRLMQQVHQLQRER